MASRKKVLLKVHLPHPHDSQGPGNCWAFTHASLEILGHHSGRQWCWQNELDESICQWPHFGDRWISSKLLTSIRSIGQQEVQCKLQGHYRRRFSHERGARRRPSGNNAGMCTHSSRIRGELRINLLIDLGYCGSRAISVFRCCILPGCGLLCSGIRRE